MGRRRTAPEQYGDRRDATPVANVASSIARPQPGPHKEVTAGGRRGRQAMSAGMTLSSHW